MQILTVLLKFIADGELLKAPLVMSMDNDDWIDEEGAGVGWGFEGYPSEEELAAFSSNYDVTLMDPAMRCVSCRLIQ